MESSQRHAGPRSLTSSRSTWKMESSQRHAGPRSLTSSRSTWKRRRF